MNSYRVLDMETWPRKELFDFYQKFDNPCFNVSVPVEGQQLYHCARDRRELFFLLALYAILRAANSVHQLRQRLVNGEVVEYDRIAVMTPIMTDQELFRQIWCEYTPAYTAFKKDAALKVEKASQGEPSAMEGMGDDYICASCLPWLHFSSISQADLHFGQAVPILAWGKLKKGVVPFSCKFSHAFVDGLHVSRFFDCVESSFAHPERLWDEHPRA